MHIEFYWLAYIKTQPKALLNSISKNIEIMKEESTENGNTHKIEKDNGNTEKGIPKIEKGIVIDEGTTDKIEKAGETEKGNGKIEKSSKTNCRPVVELKICFFAMLWKFLDWILAHRPCTCRFLATKP